MLSQYHAKDFRKETFSNVSVYGHYKPQKEELKKLREKRPCRRNKDRCYTKVQSAVGSARSTSWYGLVA